MRLSSLRVFYPTARPPLRPPASAEIRQLDYHHDMLILDYYLEKHTARRYREGTPIMARWGTFPNAFEDFYGYVLYVRPRIENENHILRLTCIGAGAPLREPTEGVYTNSSVEAVATKVALSNNLNIARPPDTHVWPLLVQPRNATQFEYLVECAQRLGYSCFIHNTTVHFYDPVKVMLANESSVPVLRYRYGRGNQYLGDIEAFTPTSGQLAKHPLRNVVLAGVDLRTKQVVELSSRDLSKQQSLYQQGRENLITEFLTGQPIQSLCTTRMALGGQTRTSRWVTSARVRARGNVRVRQGGGVFITGVSKQHDGLWHVDKVTHKLTTENHPQKWSYMMDLELLRDSEPLERQAPPLGRRVRTLTGDRVVQTNRKPPPTRLVKGQWISTHPSVLTVAA